MSAEEDSQFIRRYNALPVEARSRLRRAYGDARGLRVRIRDLAAMQNADGLPVGAAAPSTSTFHARERIVARRNRSPRHPRTPRNTGRPCTYEQRRTFTLGNRDGEPIFDITIIIKER
ncbi:hypothetical protein [Streptomyces sp. NPDC127112]|uniref:hypothetical protein n=1 Tax=Streptomyces sp. NPDC127112 TaxID=3345364 RepID=UPI0036403879